MPRKPCLRVWPETHPIPLIQISISEKGSFCLENDALSAILRVKDRESFFWKARIELCRVVGSAKTRIRKNTRKNATKKSGFCFHPSTVFQANPETGVRPFHIRSNPCFRVWPEMHCNPLVQILMENVPFLPVSSLCTAWTLVKIGQKVFSGSRHPETFRPNP